MPEQKKHPVLWLILFFPLGLSNGYVVVTLGYLLSTHGASVTAIAALGALSLWPQVLKFLWAPLVDTTLSSKTWFAMSAAATGILMAITTFVASSPSQMGLIDILVVLFSVTSGFNSMAADNLMAHATGPDEKGRAGGWSQAGNTGGSGLGGGAVLWLSQHAGAEYTGAVALILATTLPCIALFFVNEPAATHRSERYLRSLLNVLAEVWDFLRRYNGALVFFIMLVPIGVGSAQNLFSAIARDWHASADTVALTSGLLSGVVSIFGSLAGGVICDKMNRKWAYCLFGVGLALCAILMAVAPRTEIMYAVMTTLYNFTMGICYAAFGALVLESIGTGAAATKYNVLAGVSNLPILYQTVIDGWGYKQGGADGLLYTDALSGVLGVALVVAVALAAKWLFPRWAAVRAEA